MMKPKKMARPPRRGIGSSWILRESGSSMAPMHAGDGADGRRHDEDDRRRHQEGDQRRYLRP